MNLEGQLVTVGPAGPTSVSNLAERAGLTAVAQAAGYQWERATFADGSRYVVATACDSASSGNQSGVSWVAHLIPTAGGQQHALGTITDSAGDPESAGALVSAPASTSAASSPFECFGPQSAPDKAIELLEAGAGAAHHRYRRRAHWRTGLAAEGRRSCCPRTRAPAAACWRST